MTVVRRILLIASLAIAGYVLWRTMRGIDAGGVWEAITSLGPLDLARIALLFAALLLAEAALAAAFVPGLSVRRGAMAYLIPYVVSSVAPGPADYPVRYKMLRSWGYDRSAAATASAGPTLFNSAHKMVMPLVAAVAFAVGDVRVAGVGRLVIIGSAIFGATSVAALAMLGSERRTAAVGRLVERVVGRPVAHHLISSRNRSARLVRQVWRRVLVGLLLVIAAAVGLFVACMRATGTTATTANWLALLGVWATVRAISALPTTPGDVGVSEVAYVSLLTQISDQTHVNAFAAGVLLYRSLTVVVPIPLGLAALAIWRRGLRDADLAQPPDR